MPPRGGEAMRYHFGTCVVALALVFVFCLSASAVSVGPGEPSPPTTTEGSTGTGDQPSTGTQLGGDVTSGGWIQVDDPPEPFQTNLSVEPFKCYDATMPKGA